MDDRIVELTRPLANKELEHLANTDYELISNPEDPVDQIVVGELPDRTLISPFRGRLSMPDIHTELSPDKKYRFICDGTDDSAYYVVVSARGNLYQINELPTPNAGDLVPLGVYETRLSHMRVADSLNAKNVRKA